MHNETMFQLAQVKKEATDERVKQSIARSRLGDKKTTRVLSKEEFPRIDDMVEGTEEVVLVEETNDDELDFDMGVIER